MLSGKACEGDNTNLRDCALSVKERPSEEWTVVLSSQNIVLGMYEWRREEISVQCHRLIS